MPLVKMYSRSSSPSARINPTYVVGLTIAGAVVIGLSLWLILRMIRKRAASKREENMGAAFLSVRGVVVDDNVTEKNPGGLYAVPDARSRIDSSITMPEKAILRPNEQLDDLAFRQHPEYIPRHLSPKPFSFAMAATSSMPEQRANGRISRFRDSLLSTASGQNRFSVSSYGSNSTLGHTIGSKRKVRQLFNPVLPDELLISTPGEQLTVIQSFDDGWCLVGKEPSTSIPLVPKSLFKQDASSDNDIELGVVPAWCFIKPVKGLRVERPVRSSSLGITVQFQGPGFSSRDEIISWSNF
ncbi:hypothetical protein F5887DRAFT_537673 [Amanita rubescens]|nr:hypothetical protein F5887DRAFT_537673 [Amanita rubescens]